MAIETKEEGPSEEMRKQQWQAGDEVGREIVTYIWAGDATALRRRV